MIDEERFWAKVERGDGCWIWQGARDRRGYGRFHTTYKTRLPHHLGAHRVAYILTYGDVPHGLEVCHTCDNPACVRPDHLFVGTHAENMADQFAKRRNSPPPRNDGDAHWTRRHPQRVRRGGAHPRAKLMPEQVAEIRARHAQGVPQRQLAREYPVGLSQIHRIVHGTTYREV